MFWLFAFGAFWPIDIRNTNFGSSPPVIFGEGPQARLSLHTRSAAITSKHEALIKIASSCVRGMVYRRVRREHFHIIVWSGLGVFA